eukprot:scaffold77712_cov87-Phaeocystis_antarctica.AAC.2
MSGLLRAASSRRRPRRARWAGSSAANSPARCVAREFVPNIEPVARGRRWWQRTVRCTTTELYRTVRSTTTEIYRTDVEKQRRSVVSSHPESTSRENRRESNPRPSTTRVGLVISA